MQSVHPETHLSDSSEDLLFVRVHLCKCSDLGQVNIFSISQSHNFIKCEYKIKTMVRDLSFLQSSTVFRDLKEKEV